MLTGGKWRSRRTAFLSFPVPAHTCNGERQESEGERERKREKEREREREREREKESAKLVPSGTSRSCLNRVQLCICDSLSSRLPSFSCGWDWIERWTERESERRRRN